MNGFACIGLDHPKFVVNIGSALRAVEIYQAKMIVISGRRYKKTQTDVLKSYRHLPLLQVDDLKTVIPYDCIPVAVDLIPGAIPLSIQRERFISLGQRMRRLEKEYCLGVKMLFMFRQLAV